MRLKVCELLDLHPEVRRTSSYGLVEGVSPEDAASADDFRDRISPRVAWAEDAAFSPRAYWQVFGQAHGFLPNLSIADLLFNMGPEGLLVLRDSVAAL